MFFEEYILGDFGARKLDDRNRLCLPTCFNAEKDEILYLVKVGNHVTVWSNDTIVEHYKNLKSRLQNKNLTTNEYEDIINEMENLNLATRTKVDSNHRIVIPKNISESIPEMNVVACFDHAEIRDAKVKRL